MRIDLYGLDDGVIEATCNIPDSLWTSDVQTAANAAAASCGMGIDVSPLNDTIDPHVPVVTTQQGLIAWINANALTTRGTGPAPVTAPAPTTGLQVVGVIAGVGILGGLTWLAFKGFGR